MKTKKNAAWKLIGLSCIVFALTGCQLQERISMFKQKELSDKNLIILNEVAVIDSLQNEYIQITPEENYALLVSVLEIENKTDHKIPIKSYFQQKVNYKEVNYDGEIFSLDGEQVFSGKQAYVYLINKVPLSMVDEISSKKIKVQLSAGGSNLLFSGNISNNYGLQDNILHKYERMQYMEEDFQKYWGNNLEGFRKFANQRMQIKNYHQIFDWVLSVQKDYTSKVQILETNLEQMKKMNYLTPIYPDANIKMISEASYLKNRLEAIAQVENTCTSHEGVVLFIDGCIHALEEAEKENKAVLEEIRHLVRSERLKYGSFKK